jgi:hypothetical protein
MYTRITQLSKIWLVLVLGMVFTFASCTDLTDTVSDEVTSDNFFQTPQEFISAMGDAYNPLAIWGGHNGFASTIEVSTDEIAIPQRGQDWFDGGVWLRQHRHTWRYDEPHINNAWQDLFRGVNNANRLIYQFETAVANGTADAEQAAEFISELKIMRAFYYYWLLDMFGNVPIVTSFDGAPEAPSQPSSDFNEGRLAVFNFVEQELLNNIGDVSDDVQSTYGRANQYVAHFVLAKLYLNAEVYTGTPRWEDAITHLDAIIDSGNYSLASSYRDNFVTNNSGSPEIIFAVPYDKVFLQGFNIHHMSLHYGSQTTFQLQEQPWNGYATLEEFYNSYTDPNLNPGPQGTVIGSDGSETQGTVDERLSNFLAGPQYTAGGERVMDDAATDADPDGAPLTFTPEINELEPGAVRQAGARIGKWEIEIGATSSLSNDFSVFRYADVLLMKAEALWRLNPADAEALILVNQVRTRAGVDPFLTLDADKLLAERGRELFYEMWRRQDLIRFDSNSGNATRYNDAWWEKGPSEDWRNVFPIPRDQLEANPNLVQHSHSEYQG